MYSIHSILSKTTLLLCFVALFSFPACMENSSDSSSQGKEAPAPPQRSLHEAAYMGDVALIQAHIAAGSDLNKKDDFGSTPLIVATTFGKTEVAKQLINAGADLNATGADGGTALHGAAFYCQTEIVQALLENGADPHVRNLFGSTALESVSGPFGEVKMIYDQISKDLGPLGFKLDYAYLEATRPEIAKTIEQTLF